MNRWHRALGVGVRERVLREVSEIYEGNAYFGGDLMEIPFAAPAAAEHD